VVGVPGVQSRRVNGRRARGRWLGERSELAMGGEVLM
jgi:hypothetical protein